MSFTVENRQTNKINNKGRENSLPYEMKEDYSFKYIPESHFKHIVKNVQRQRQKEDEERIWTSFVKEQESTDLRFDKTDLDWSIQSVKDLLQENIQGVDSELKRLQEDAFPECCKGIHHCKSNIRNEKTYAGVNSGRNGSSKDRSRVKDKDVCGPNILIPRSMEGNVSNHKESKGLKKVVRSKAKKSVSDPSLILKKRYTNQLLRATNQCENNSDSDSSNSRNDIVNIQPDPLTVQKIVSMQKKIAELLDEISFRLCRIPLPDGDNDLKRRQQQTMEFGIRFSRNYLYDLNRLVDVIQRHLGTLSPKISLKPCHKSIVFCQDMIKEKLVASHQLLVQALSAYCKHIPNSILEGHPTKLQDAFQVVCKLNDICKKVEISTDYYCSGDANILPLSNDLQDKCNTILSKLKLSLESKRQPTTYKNVDSTITLTPLSLHNRKCSNQTNLSGRLSMYSIDVKASKSSQKRRNDLRRKSHSCQKDRKCNTIDIKSVYNQHCSVPELLYPSPVTQRSSSRDNVGIDYMENTNYSKEDEIKTVMDEVPMDFEDDSTVEIQPKHINGIKVQQQSLVLQNPSSVRRWKCVGSKEKGMKGENIINDDDLVKKVTTITKEHLSTLVPVISDLVTLVSQKHNGLEGQPVSETSMETLLEFLQRSQFPKDSNTKAPFTDDFSDHSRHKLNGPPEIQKHGENVQLICMSSVDKVPKMTQCDASCQADCTNMVKTLNGRKTMGFNGKDRIELNTSKKIQLEFLTYKHEYKKLCQSKPMYSSNTQNKPWDIVAWISDKLMEEVITEVVKPLEMENVIQRLYEMEFQEF